MKKWKVVEALFKEAIRMPNEPAPPVELFYALVALHLNKWGIAGGEFQIGYPARIPNSDTHQLVFMVYTDKDVPRTIKASKLL